MPTVFYTTNEMHFNLIILLNCYTNKNKCKKIKVPKVTLMKKHHVRWDWP